MILVRNASPNIRAACPNPEVSESGLIRRWPARALRIFGEEFLGSLDHLVAALADSLNVGRTSM